MLRFIKEKTHVPKLRFKIGKGPFGRKRLDEIAAKKISYGIVQAGDHVPDGMPYIKSMDLNGMLALENLERTSSEIAKKYRRSEVGPGDIVFSLRGNIGVAQIVPESIAVSNLTQGTARIAVGEDYNKYICCTLQSSDVVRQVQAYAKGSTFREISLEDLRKVMIAVPSLPEQQKIADFLTAVDGRIGQLIQKKALLEDYKKGVMQQLFTQAIRFKDDEGNDFPDWEEKKLADVAEVVGGGTPASSNDTYWEGAVIWFTPSEIRSKYASDSKRMISEVGLKKSSASMLPQGALLLTSRATIAEVSIATKPCTTNQGFQSVIANSATNNEFLYYWILQSKKEFLRRAQGSTFLEIGGKEVRKIPIEAPSLREQTKIADFLSAIDHKIESVATQITETQTFKRGLLQQMFV